MDKKNSNGEKMKTKKLQAGVYQITTNKDIYKIQQNDELFDKGWEIFSKNGKEDVASTLSEAKQFIQLIEGRA